MSQNANFILLADYNTWMNTKLYDAAATLPVADLAADRGAFFGSIIGTLNHIVLGDTVWLQRFVNQSRTSQLTFPTSVESVRQLPTPTTLNAILFTDLAELRQRRMMLDAAISSWIATLTDEDVAQNMNYSNMLGTAQCKQLGSLLLHFFNHQTHHRGQTTTLLTQAGVDIGVTDLVALIPNKIS